MLRTILQKECRFHLAGFPLRVGMLLTLVLTASSTLIATRDYNLRLSDYRDRVAAHARALREETVYSFLQPVVVRPPEPLSVLDQGFDAHLGSEVPIHLFDIPAEARGGYWGNEFLGPSPAADLTTIVAIVLGLLALLLALDAFHSERESGTLSSLLALGVPRGILLTGKILGGLLSLALPLAGALLVSLAIFVLQVDTLSSSQWLRAAGLTAAYLSYLSLMFLLGLLVSMPVQSRSRALAVAVVVWLATVLVLPGTVRTLVADLGSSQEARQAAARRSAELLAERDQRLAEEQRREPLRAVFSGDHASSFSNGPNRAVRYRYGSAVYYDALSAYYRIEIATGMRYAEAVFTERQRFEERLRSTERLATAFALISPAALLDGLSEELAGTSIGEYDRFLAACRSYRLALIRYLGSKDAFASWRWFTDDPPERLHPWPRFLGLAPEEVEPEEVRRLFERFGDPKVASRVRREQARFERDPARRLQIDEVPRFADPGAGFLECLRRGAPEAFGLLLLNVLALIAVAARFRRWLPG
ncbi:MAG TPA: ABC transporter permease subunit [Thermoanaerobaculia bacterium]|nr:ABC transporter permease subunit [Thermoanaerobaculia bacterium]